jgi:hypothetical protein
MRRVVSGLLLAGLAVSGCATSSPAIEPTPRPSEAGSAPACDAIVLRAPDGQSVFLTGTWTGAGDPNAVPKPSVYYLTQTNDCLVWVGLSAEEGEPLGASWIEAFHGTISSDFVIRGRWYDVLGQGGRGAIEVRIEFVPVGGMYHTELRLLDSTGDAHLVKRWVREGSAR